MSTKHTPGPWTVLFRCAISTGEDAGWMIGTKEAWVAKTTPLVPLDGGAVADTCADAALIAAAPELAEALLEVVQRRERAAANVGGSPDGSDGRYVRARAALKKAGVTP